MRLYFTVATTLVLTPVVRADHDPYAPAAHAPAKHTPAAPVDCGVLMAGEGFGPGAQLSSCDGRFHLTLEPRGGLTLRRAGVGLLWSSKTAGSAISHVVMRPEGVLALVDDEGAIVWQSHAFGIADSYARLDDDGNLRVLAPGGRPLWHTDTAQWPVEPPGCCGVLRAGEGLTVGGALASCDGRFTLALDELGELALREGGQTLWRAEPTGVDARYLRLEEDGELALYAADGGLVWSSEVRGVFAASASIDPTGALVVTTSSGDVVWSSAQ